jgi:branched-subunit amino acid transport protein
MEGFWPALALVTAGTFVLRTFLLARRRPAAFPPRVAAAMGYVPVSILAALVCREFLLGDGPVFPRLAAGAAALCLALAFGKDLLTIAAGLGIFWLLGAMGIAPF